MTGTNDGDAAERLEIVVAAERGVVAGRTVGSPLLVIKVPFLKDLKGRSGSCTPCKVLLMLKFSMPLLSSFSGLG